MTKACERCELALPDFLVGRLDPARVPEVERHLAGCAACRGWAEEVRALYGVPEDFAPAPPAVLAFPLDTAPVRRPGGWRRRAAAGLVALAAGATALVLADPFGGDADEAASVRTAERPPALPPTLHREAPAAEGVRVPLPAIRLSLPDLPAPAEHAWTSSFDEALALAAYSGKPLLEIWTWPDCPRCARLGRELDEVLAAPRAMPVLDDFVVLRRRADEEAPADLDGAPPGKERDAVFPAVRVRDGDCRTPAAWEVADLEGVEKVLAAYWERCVEDGPRERPPLEEEVHRWALASLRSVPELVRAGRFSRAVDELESVAALGSAYRTRFAEDARALAAELGRALEARAAALERLSRGSPRERAEAARRARALLEGVRGLPVEARVAALCR